jgi:hypothetical protein
MHARALHLTALGARPLSTGNLLADCERWCRDHLPRHRSVRGVQPISSAEVRPASTVRPRKSAMVASCSSV